MTVQKPTCFVIMPFGKAGSGIRQKFDKVYKFVITSSLKRAGYTCKRGDELASTEDILKTVKSELQQAELVVADLSDRNPNVFYELGFRHALNKRTITITCSEELDEGRLPFNVRQYRTIGYDIADIESVEKCRESIQDMADHFHSEYMKEKVSEESGQESQPTLSELDQKLEIGFSNLFHLIRDVTPGLSVETENALKELIKPAKLISEQATGIEDIRRHIDELRTSTKFVQQATQLGVVSVYRSRLDAIEQEFYRKIQDEEEGIDIVGSTIFGLKGRSLATNAKILEVLRSKANQPGFKLRILLTHWDYVSGRQAQEKTDKNVARYVISKELLDAVRLLESKGLANCVRFYKGAPTCFTIICTGEHLMLSNPYPYEREAFNSWTIIFTDTYGGIYEEFQKAHFEQPWENSALTVPYDEKCMPELEKKYREEIKKAKEDLEQEIDMLGV